MTDTLAFNCTRCGSAKFEMPESPKDADVVVCAGCGVRGTYRDIKTAMMAQAKKHVNDIFDKSLGPLFKRR
jgi:DNA-directed RNA polymerase subunit RPC12/RpoP